MKLKAKTSWKYFHQRLPVFTTLYADWKAQQLMEPKEIMWKTGQCWKQTVASMGCACTLRGARRTSCSECKAEVCKPP